MRPEHPLARLDRELHVPPQRRLELLEELGADMEALQHEFERRGIRRRPARRAALHRLVPSGDTLRTLEAQHAPALGRWARSAGLAQRAERTAVAGVAIAAAALSMAVLQWSGGPGAPAVPAWIEIGLIGLLGANWSQAVLRLWLTGDLRPARRRILWRRHVGIIVAAVALGAFGAAWEAYLGLGSYGAVPAAPLPWGALRRALSLATLGFGAATFGLFGWLSLMPRLITDETIERRISTFFARSPLAAKSHTHPRRQS